MGFFDKFREVINELVEGKPTETNEKEESEVKEEGKEQERKQEVKDENQGIKDVKVGTNSEDEKEREKESVRIFVYGSVYKYIKEYGAKLDIFDISEGENNSVSRKVYDVKFQLYGDHECFEVDTQVILRNNERGELKDKTIGESTITLIGEWISKLGYTSESETHTIKGDYREEIGRYIEKYRGINKEVFYKPSYDGKDRERVARMVKLLKESDLKVKVDTNDKYGDYFMIPLGKKVNVISTPTLVIETTSKQVLYNKHTDESNLENSLGKIVKEKDDKDLYKNAKDFIDIYKRANDLRRTVD